jgi:NAD(P)-dependent dehydrogenase (short-subunit alcohol dehydrogenase family)
MGKFDGKIALVGGNLGKAKDADFKIGLGGTIAKKLAEEGAKVIVVDINAADAEACAKAIGANAKAMACDLMKDRTSENIKTEDGKSEIKWTDNPALTMVEEIVKEHGKLDILITNFDEFEQGRVDKIDDELYNKLRDANIWPTFHLLAAVREQFSKQTKTTGTYAKVVMMTNMVGKAGMSLGSIYAAFKAGIIGMTKGLAREFGRFANVNAVAMGPLSQKPLQGPKDRIKKSFMVTQTEMSNQEFTFDKIAPMAVFLASDDAIAITGQTISVDGGLWLKLEQ